MKYWPHAPLHFHELKGAYIVTGSTLYKEKLFSSETDKDMLQEQLFKLAELYHWKLEAWAIFSNHYHIIAHSTDQSISLKKFITHLHSYTAILLNKSHNTPGRAIWYQFWDTHLSFHHSYLARLKYVMTNPVKHGLVTDATLYPWCSANWYMKTSAKTYLKTISSFKIDKLNFDDGF